MFLDIHSHILPAVDDGAKNLNESFKLLRLMKKDGITHCLATPHFFPELMSLDEFISSTVKAYKKLNSAIEDKRLPKIYLGAEVLYYKGIGSAHLPSKICLNGSVYILLELSKGDIKPQLFADLEGLMKSGYKPVIAHIERYRKERNFKKLIKFAVKYNIPVQINAHSITVPALKREIKRLLKTQLFCVLATDTHSCDTRPPFLSEALDIIEKEFGTEMRLRLLKNTRRLKRSIIGEKIDK